MREYLRKWKEANPEKQRAYDRAYYRRNRKRILRRQRDWQARNPKKMRQYAHKYRRSHPALPASQRDDPALAHVTEKEELIPVRPVQRAAGSERSINHQTKG